MNRRKLKLAGTALAEALRHKTARDDYDARPRRFATQAL